MAFWTALLAQVLAAGALGLSSWRRGSALKTQRLQAKGEVASALGAVLNELSAAANGEPEKFATVSQLAMSELKTCMMIKDPRMCIYRLELPDANGGRRRLVLYQHSVGKHPIKRHAFVEDEEDRVAQANFVCIDERRERLVESTIEARHREDIDADGRPYKSFLNVPIVIDGIERAEGLLTIDCSEERGLTVDHVPLALMLARFLAIAMRDNAETMHDRAPVLRPGMLSNLEP